MKIQNLLENLSIKPAKSLGQNFLNNEDVSEASVEKFSIPKNSYLVEIGPGLGALTKYLLKDAKHLIAIEYDKRLCDYLNDNFALNKKITIICQDILKYDWSDLKNQKKVIVVGNLPYNLATKILQKLLIQKNNLSSLFLSFPEEIGQKILAKPKTKKYGYLSIITKIFSEAKLLQHLKSEDFFPKPKIESVFIKFELKTILKLKTEDILTFLELIKKCFMHRRKTLINNFKNFKTLTQMQKITIFFEKQNWKINIRSEELDHQSWIKLFNFLKTNY